MADVKISALPVAASVLTTDLIPIVQAGVTDQATVAQVRTAILPILSAELAPGTAYHVVRTNAAGTAVESGAVDLTTAAVTGVLPTANQAAPTGTGMVTVTSGAWDAAATVLGTGVATWLTTPSSANLLAAVTGETGSGALVFGTSPTIDAPTVSGIPVLSGASASTSNNAKGTLVDINPVNVQTTDATVTTLDSFTIATGSTVVVSWLVAATSTGAFTGAGYSVSAVFRNYLGTVAQVGTTTTTVIGEDTAGWDATADNSTTTIRLRVTGAVATTVQWTSILTRLTVIP